ncbi:hypothetical protein OHB05_00825 [Streptomyces sp. NBC_00638]|uniref:hypothetical protein n=1 Tax=unclassified Streptomyces TaxID=2593676 RepID=UPI0022579DDB|nr:hypothetical protein [Streptomyces sp. NBC_00638]MCX5001174.1 hypothetical protein [Streptomyces sp. NBC_00638]
MSTTAHLLTASGFIALLVWGATSCDDQPVDPPSLPLPALCTPDDCPSPHDDPVPEPAPQNSTTPPFTPPPRSGCAYWGEIGCPDTPIYIPPPDIGRPWS